MYSKKTLDNGIRILSFNMPSRNSLSLGIWINAGARNEDADENGISHLLEHMLFKGSSKYSCYKLKESIEGIGGALNGFTSQEATCYFAKIPYDHYEVAVDVLSDMVLEPTISSDDLKKEKEVILEEIKMYKDLPQVYVHDIMEQLLWPGHPLGRNIAGTEKSVSSISREKLFNFKGRFYNSSNIVIAACGQLKDNNIVDRLSDRFLHLNSGANNDFIEASFNQTGLRLNILEKETEQIHMVIGFHGVSRINPDRYKLQLLNVILGGNMSSRLFNEVREKRGLAYEIGTSLKKFKDTGAFIINVGVDKIKLIEAIKVILEELSRVKNELVSIDELKRAKDFFSGQINLALDDTMEHMLWIGDQETALGNILKMDEVLNSISKVTREEILEIAKGVFVKEHLNVAVIGPVSSEQNKIKNLAENFV